MTKLEKAILKRALILMTPGVRLLDRQHQQRAAAAAGDVSPPTAVSTAGDRQERGQRSGGGCFPDGDGKAKTDKGLEEHFFDTVLDDRWTQFVLKLPIVQFIALFYHSPASFEDNQAILETFGIVSTLLLSFVIAMSLSVSYEDTVAANERFGFLNNVEMPMTRRAHRHRRCRGHQASHPSSSADPSLAGDLCSRYLQSRTHALELDANPQDLPATHHASA